MGFFTKLVNRSRYYNLIRYSRVSDFIVEFLTGKTARNIDFYRSLVPDQSWQQKLVFDVGANKGNKTRAFLDLGARVLCVEPEKKALETLAYRFGSNPLVKIAPHGVSDSVGEMRLFVKDYRSGYNTLSDKWQKEDEQAGEPLETYLVTVTTLTELIEKFGTPFFIKVDVEGFELPVIKGLKKAVPLLSFEANLPEFREETQSILDHLFTLYGPTIQIRFFKDEQPLGGWVGMEEARKQVDHWNKHGVELVIRKREDN